MLKCYLCCNLVLSSPSSISEVTDLLLIVSSSLTKVLHKESRIKHIYKLHVISYIELLHAH